MVRRICRIRKEFAKDPAQLHPFGGAGFKRYAHSAGPMLGGSWRLSGVRIFRYVLMDVLSHHLLVDHLGARLAVFMGNGATIGPKMTLEVPKRCQNVYWRNPK